MSILGSCLISVVFLPVDNIFAVKVRVVDQLPLGLILGTAFMRSNESSLIFEGPGAGCLNPPRHLPAVCGIFDVAERSCFYYHEVDRLAPLPKSTLRGIFISNADWDSLQRWDGVMGSPHKNGGGQLSINVHYNIPHNTRPRRSDTSVCSIYSVHICYDERTEFILVWKRMLVPEPGTFSMIDSSRLGKNCRLCRTPLY